MSADVTAVGTVEHAGFTISGTGVSEESLKALDPGNGEAAPAGDEKETADPKDALSKAASELGKKGGEAAAKARKEAAKESAKPIKPIPDKPAAKNEVAAPVEPAKEAAEPEAKEETAEEIEERKSRARERVEQATRDAAEARREVQRLREELERTRREIARPEGKAEPEAAPKQEAKGKPDPEQFERYEDYLDARDQYNREQWEAEHKQRQALEQRSQRVNGAMETFFGKLGEAAKADPDFHGRTVSFVGELQPSFLVKSGEIKGLNRLSDEIILSEHSGKLVDYFSEHRDEYQRLATLQAREITRAVAKIEARLEDATSGNPSSTERPASKPAVSQAPPPVRPVTGVPSTASGGVYREGMSFDEWNAKQRKR